MNEKYLPVGTVVTLKNATHKIIIIGFCLTNKKKGDKQYDYSAVFYPEGYIGPNGILCFDHEDIDHIDQTGFSNDDEKEFKKRLVASVKFISSDDGHHVSFDKLNELLTKGLDDYEQ